MKETTRSWLRSCLLAPWICMAACVTVGVPVAGRFGQLDPKFSPFAHWAGMMLAGSVASVLISLSLIAVDYVRTRLRTLPPVGIRAWLSGVLAFAMFAGLFRLFLPVLDNDFFVVGGVRDFYILVLASIPASAVFARLVLGSRRRLSQDDRERSDRPKWASGSATAQKCE